MPTKPRDWSADDKKAISLLKRIVLMAAPLGDANPPTIEVDSVNGIAGSGEFIAMTRADFKSPNAVTIELSSEQIDSCGPPGDGTVQIAQVLKELGIPDDKWSMAYLVKGNRKAGLCLQIDKESYRAVARLTSSRLLTDPKLATELAYAPGNFRDMLRHSNSLPAQMFENMLSQSNIEPQALPRLIAAAASAECYEIAARLRDRMGQARENPAEARSGRANIRAQDDSCEGKGGKGSSGKGDGISL